MTTTPGIARRGLSYPETRRTSRPLRRVLREPERVFQRKVLEVATLHGWQLQYHAFDSRRSTGGWPDLVLLRPPRALFIELKAEDGKVTPEQWEWLCGLTECGFETHIWSPRDWDELLRVLRR